MSEVYQWSTTAASNNSTPPDGFPEQTDGYVMQFSEVNDSMREAMAAIKRLYLDKAGTLELTLYDTVSFDRYYSVTTNQAITTLAEGMILRAYVTQPASMTQMYLNTNSLGAVEVLEADGTTVIKGDLEAGRCLYNLRFNGTNWIITQV